MPPAVLRQRRGIDVGLDGDRTGEVRIGVAAAPTCRSSPASASSGCSRNPRRPGPASRGRTCDAQHRRTGGRPPALHAAGIGEASSRVARRARAARRGPCRPATEGRSPWCRQVPRRQFDLCRSSQPHSRSSACATLSSVRPRLDHHEEDEQQLQHHHREEDHEDDGGRQRRQERRHRKRQRRSHDPVGRAAERLSPGARRVRKISLM